MIYIGIDPGKSGAMAILNGDPEEHEVEIIPYDPEAYFNALDTKYLYRKICCLERVGAMPGQGVTSMFRFGENFGIIQGILIATKTPFELVMPQKWKKEFGITGDKNSSIAVCKRLFPDVSLLPTERCRKDNDGMAEALLMAEYARRRL